jgi:hypothetical protein
MVGLYYYMPVSANLNPGGESRVPETGCPNYPASMKGRAKLLKRLYIYSEGILKSF